MASIGLNSSLVKTVMLKVIGDGGDANRMLDEIAAKAEALQAEHPELTVQINRAQAMADAVVMKAEMAKLLNTDPVEMKIEPDFAPFRTAADEEVQKFFADLAGMENGNSGLFPGMAGDTFFRGLGDEAAQEFFDRLEGMTTANGGLFPGMEGDTVFRAVGDEAAQKFFEGFRAFEPQGADIIRRGLGIAVKDDIEQEFGALEAELSREGPSLMSRLMTRAFGGTSNQGTGIFQNLMYSILRGMSLGKLPALGGAGGAGGEGTSVAEEGAAAGAEGGVGLSPLLGPALLAGAPVAAAALLGIVNEIGGLVAGFAAAGQGVVAFGALAYPEFSKLLAAVEAGKAGLKGLDGAQRGIVQGAQNIENEYKRLAAQLAPDVDKILGQFTMKGGIASQILQDLVPFAKAAAGPILELAKNFDKFLASPGAAEFQRIMLRLEGPSILAIGEGIGKVAVAIGKLLEAFSHGNAPIHAINILFDGLAGLINSIATWVTKADKNWEEMKSAFETASRDVVGAIEAIERALTGFVTGAAGLWTRANHDVANWAQDVEDWLTRVVDWFLQLPGKIADALGRLPLDLFNIGSQAIQGLINGIEHMAGGVASAIGRIASSIPSGIMHLLGIGSPSKVTTQLGEYAGQGVAVGLDNSVSLVGSAARRLTASLASGLSFAGAGTGYGGGMAIALSMEGGDGPISAAIMQAIRAEVTAKGGGGTNSVQRTFGKRA